MSNNYVVVSSTGWQPTTSSKSATASASVASGRRDATPYDTSRFDDQYLSPLRCGRRPGTFSAPTSSTISSSMPVRRSPPSRSARSSPSPIRQTGLSNNVQQHSDITAVPSQTRPPFQVPLQPNFRYTSSDSSGNGYIGNAFEQPSFRNLWSRIVLGQIYRVYVHRQPNKALAYSELQGHPRSLKLYIEVNGIIEPVYLNSRSLACSKQNATRVAHKFYSRHIFPMGESGPTGLVAYRQDRPPDEHWPQWQRTVLMAPMS